MTKKIKQIDIIDIEFDYLPNEEDDDKMLELKKVVQELDEIDRRILLIYSETMSQRETGKILGVSASTICQRIAEIREKIKNKLYGIH